MLRFLRKYSSSIGIKVLYGVLALLFIGWGVGAIGGSAGRTSPWCTAGDQPRDLEQAKAALSRQYEQLLRGRADSCAAWTCPARRSIS